MRYRLLGTGGLQVSELFLGTMTFGEQAVRRLDDSTGFVAGFPTDFITETGPWVFGESSKLVDGRRSD